MGDDRSHGCGLGCGATRSDARVRGRADVEVCRPAPRRSNPRGAVLRRRARLPSRDRVVSEERRVSARRSGRGEGTGEPRRNRHVVSRERLVERRRFGRGPDHDPAPALDDERARCGAPCGRATGRGVVVQQQRLPPAPAGARARHGNRDRSVVPGVVVGSDRRHLRGLVRASRRRRHRGRPEGKPAVGSRDERARHGAVRSARAARREVGRRTRRRPRCTSNARSSLRPMPTRATATSGG